MSETKQPKVRNAYQKVKAGDTVYFSSSNLPTGIGSAVINSKGRYGVLEVSVDGKPAIIYGMDIIAITRNGQGVY